MCEAVGLLGKPAAIHTSTYNTHTHPQQQRVALEVPDHALGVGQRVAGEVAQRAGRPAACRRDVPAVTPAGGLRMDGDEEWREFWGRSVKWDWVTRGKRDILNAPPRRA